MRAILTLPARLRQPVSGLSHLAGAILAAIGLISILGSAHASKTGWHFTAFLVFGCSMITLYLSSTLYHLLPLSERGIQRLRRVDHMMIYVFIAGTYTPFCLVPLRAGRGLGMFTAIWIVAAIGVAVKLLWFESSRWLRVAPYVAMSALSVVILPELVHQLPTRAVVWTAAGALIYGIGALIYATKRPDPIPEVLGFHEIWHFFVLAGSFCHFWVMREYVLYL